MIAILKPAGQHTIVSITGADNGIYRRFPEPYVKLLKREGLTLDIGVGKATSANPASACGDEPNLNTRLVATGRITGRRRPLSIEHLRDATQAAYPN